MIPPKQLPGLKPLPDQVKRMRAIKHQRTIPQMRINLTPRQRRYASYPASLQKSSISGEAGPNNYRMYNLD